MLPEVAVITPYYDETVGVLERCHESVRSQSYPCTHFLIADGVGITAVDQWLCRHVRLGKPHADNGNTPRSIGSICAMNEGYDAIAFLDADNLYLNDHISTAVQAWIKSGCTAGAIISERTIFFPDGQSIDGYWDPEDAKRIHADTSCITIFKNAFSMLSLFAEMPKELGPFCDRVFFQRLCHAFEVEYTCKATVLFETWYDGHFSAIGRTPPITSKALPLIGKEQYASINKDFKERSANHFVYTYRPDEHFQGLSIAAIFGAPRSGTTIMQMSLCMLKPFIGIPEHNLFSRYLENVTRDIRTTLPGHEILRRISDFYSNGYEWCRHVDYDLENLLDQSSTYDLSTISRLLYSSSLDNETQSLVKKWRHAVIVDKTLSTSRFAKEFFEIYPSSKCILLIRRPIDQIASMAYIASNNHETWQALSLTIEERCLEYIHHILPALRYAPSRQIMIVEHEKHIQNPYQISEACASFLNPAQVSKGKYKLAPLSPEIKPNQLNHRYELSMKAARQRVAKMIARETEPWKSEALSEPIRALSRKSNRMECLAEKDLLFVEELFSPLRNALDGQPVSSSVKYSADMIKIKELVDELCQRVSMAMDQCLR